MLENNGDDILDCSNYGSRREINPDTYGTPNLIMYDIHSHILPGVDDGPKTMNDALEMASVADEKGTKMMLCTPHRRDVTENSSVKQVQQLLTTFKAEIDQIGLGLDLVLGMENHIDVDLPDEVSAGRALPINGGHYMLVEMPFFGNSNYVEDVLFQLQIQGIKPVLAHPERIEAIQQDPEKLVRLIERGMVSQITGGSIVGYFGKDVKKLTHSLLRRGMVHIIASDTHFATGPRSPDLSECVSAAAEVVGEDRALAMVVDTPRAVLNDLSIELESVREDSDPRRWWQVFKH